MRFPHRRTPGRAYLGSAYAFFFFVIGGVLGLIAFDSMNRGHSHRIQALFKWSCSGAGLSILAAIVSLALGFCRRRVPGNHCPTCGYNLAGLNRDAGVGVCPECGKAKTV